MTHSLTSYFLLSNFNTATVADNSFVTDSFILTAMTFPIFYRTENSLTEQTTPFRLVGSVVDGFWFHYFTTVSFPELIPEKQD